MFNNGALSFVELEMKAAGIVNYGTDLDNPDFAAIARATGLFGVRVDKAGDLPDALREAFGHDGPALVDVHTVREELSLPPKLTYGQLKGFTLYATRTILSGGERSSSSSPSPTSASSRPNNAEPHLIVSAAWKMVATSTKPTGVTDVIGHGRPGPRLCIRGRTLHTA